MEVAKLHLEKNMLRDDTLIGLNSSMINSNHKIEYVSLSIDSFMLPPKFQTYSHEKYLETLLLKYRQSKIRAHKIAKFGDREARLLWCVEISKFLDED